MIKISKKNTGIEKLGESTLHDVVALADDHLRNIKNMIDLGAKYDDETLNVYNNSATYEWCVEDLGDRYSVISTFIIKGNVIDLNDLCHCDEDKVPAIGRKLAEKMARKEGVKYFINYTTESAVSDLLSCMGKYR
jgi:hypothetical protein